MGFRVIEGTQFPILKGNYSVKNVGGVIVLFSAYCLMMLYICTKFHENI